MRKFILNYDWNGHKKGHVFEADKDGVYVEKGGFFDNKALTLFILSGALTEVTEEKHTCGSWPDSGWSPDDFKRKLEAKEKCPACIYHREQESVGSEGSSGYTIGHGGAGGAGTCFEYRPKNRDRWCS